MASATHSLPQGRVLDSEFPFIVCCRIADLPIADPGPTLKDEFVVQGETESLALQAALAIERCSGPILGMLRSHPKFA